ncbi:sulfatase [Svornostia abyssi]|uniref:Sulfatase n=1 Tax=Svornostia abyssi TaxID=2898438 RepID=A0ABY5PAP2_9ACTN|nr:sulfatase [Parviterribacteraceae bacterium J379]
MRLRPLTRWLVAIAAIIAAPTIPVALSADSSPTSSSETPPAGKPNIVMLMTDDQTLEMMRYLPKTQAAIGDRGITFSRSYASYPVCCPSRSTYLTGRYAHNHKVLSNQPPNGGYAALNGNDTLPVWLKNAGYTTTHIGKYLNGYGLPDKKEIPPGWTDWHGAIDPSTYWFWGFQLNNNGKVTRYGTPGDEDPALYQTDVYSTIATTAIARNAKAGKPFFLSVAFGPSHGEIPYPGVKDAGGGEPVFVAPRSAPRHRGDLAGTKAPRTDAFNEADVSDKPAWLQKSYGSMDEKTVTALDIEYAARAESLLAVDEAVEQITDQLEESGVADNTLVVFTSDNGFMQGEHRIPGGKYVVYEPSTRVPLLMRGPGITRGSISDELVANVDLAPTIAAAAGGLKPSSFEFDGRSLLPFASDPAKTSDRPILLETTGSSSDAVDGQATKRQRLEAEGPSPYRAIRVGAWKYVEYTTGERELYDLQADPQETTSLHADPKYAEVVADLSKRLAALQQCTGASCQTG